MSATLTPTETTAEPAPGHAPTRRPPPGRS